MALASKLALVTGSTSGIGLGIAKTLAGRGCDVVLNGFGSSKDIETLLKNVADTYKVKVFFDDADLMKVDQIERMMGSKQCGGIDILVNNAGIQHVANVDDFPVSKWNDIIALNLNAVFHTTRLVLPSMKKKNFGRIINIASVHGLVGSAGKSAYVAAKHGVVGLTKVTALETAKSNVTCNAICPGWVLTPLVQKQIDDRATAQGLTQDESKVQLLREKQPSQDFASPEQLGELAAFLSSDAAAQVRGVAWAMDGCWTAQ